MTKVTTSIRNSLLIVVFSTLISVPAYASEKFSSWVLAPVYFVTDRVPNKVDGKIQKFTDNGQALTNTSAGIMYVPVPKRNDIIVTWETLKSLGWKDESEFQKAVGKDKEQQAKWAAKSISNMDLTDSEVIASIKKLPAFSGSTLNKSELLVFIHGFYNDFDDSIKTGAELSSFFKRPIIVYSWMTPRHELQPKVMTIPKIHWKIPIPMPDIWQSYRESEVTFQHSQERLNALIGALDLSVGAQNMILVAHSMGTRLLDQALICRHGYFDKIPEEKKFSAVIFSNPDLDGRYFTSHADELAEETKNLRVFFVSQDEAMEASRFLHGAHYRLGAPNASIFTQLRQTPIKLVNMSELDTEFIGDMGHSLPCWLLANFHKYQTSDVGGEKYTDEKPFGNDSLTIIHRTKKHRK